MRGPYFVYLFKCEALGFVDHEVDECNGDAVEVSEIGVGGGGWEEAYRQQPPQMKKTFDCRFAWSPSTRYAKVTTSAHTSQTGMEDIRVE